MTVHAPAGGHVELNHRFYSGGQFLPFWVPRVAMPQIDDVPALLEYLDNLGVGWRRTNRNPDNLCPHQRVDTKHARTIPEEVLALPCLVAEDGFILDGHHRWAAHKMRGTLCPVIEVGAPFDDAIGMLLSFPGARHAGAHEFAPAPV